MPDSSYSRVPQDKKDIGILGHDNGYEKVIFQMPSRMHWKQVLSSTTQQERGELVFSKGDGQMHLRVARQLLTLCGEKKPQNSTTVGKARSDWTARKRSVADANIYSEQTNKLCNPLISPELNQICSGENVDEP